MVTSNLRSSLIEKMSSQESRELDRRIAEEMREAISSLESEALQGEEGLAASGWSSLLKARAARARRRRRALLLYSSSAAVVLLLLSLLVETSL